MKRFSKVVRSGHGGKIFNHSSREEPVIVDRLRPEDFVLTKLSRYGFPYQPTCLAYDPVQSILAIGAYDGSIRILGKPSVECHVQHESSAAVKELIFLINEGALISLCDDDYVHLWNLRQAHPALVQSLRFNREKLTCMHLPFSSKWLFVGTERGNVHVVNIESFKLSGYTIHWNKAIEIKCKAHPGPVVHISGNPADPNKLLLGFDTGMAVVWSLRGKTVEHRVNCSKSVVSAHWLNDGKRFMCSHTDGTLTVWSLKNSDKPVETLSPHTSGKSIKERPCQPIFKVQWLAVSSGDPFVLFSGGTCSSKKKGLTLMQGHSLRVLCTDTVLDFVCITSTPWGEGKTTLDIIEQGLLCVNRLNVTSSITTFRNHNYEKNQKLMFCYCLHRLTSFEVPYTFNIHDSPVTCTQFCSDCPSDFLKALGAAVGGRSKKRQLLRENSQQPWPIVGGILSEPPEDANGELIVTGHSDGSVKFWAATSADLKCLYKLSTSKIFEKNTNSAVENSETNGKDVQSEGSSSAGCESSTLSMVDLDCHAVNKIELCVRSRTLLVAGTSHVIVYQFSMSEETLELVQLDINMTFDPNQEFSPQSPGEPSSLTDDRGEGLVFSPKQTSMTMSCPALTCKTGLYKRTPGFQPFVCCLTSVGGGDAIPVSALAVSSEFGVICISNGPCLALVDIVQRKLITVLSAQDMCAVSGSPVLGTPTTPIQTGTPLTFSVNSDGTGGEFHVDINSKSERRKSRPVRPPPPVRRLSNKSDGMFMESVLKTRDAPAGSDEWQLDINMTFDPNQEFSPQSPGEPSSLTDDRGEGLVFSSKQTSMTMSCPALTCKTGLYKRTPGFQPFVCCLTSVGGGDAIPVSALAVSSEFGVICISNGPCLALVDIVQRKLITVLSAQDMCAVSGSPVLGTPTTPIQTGTPLTFSVNSDGTGGEFHVDINSKSERRKSRPVRPPPPVRRLSNKSDGSDVTDGARQRTASGVNLELRPPDSINCLQFACTFTKKNGNSCYRSCAHGQSLLCLQLCADKAYGSIQWEMTPKSLLCSKTAAVITNEEEVDGVKYLDKFTVGRQSQVRFPFFSAVTLLPVTSHFFLAPFCIAGSSCLLCLNSLGKVLAFSLPNLSLLMDVECTFLMNDYRFLKTLVFSEDAQAVILCSPFEIQRLSMFARPGMLTENQDSLFRVMDTPEPPSKGFFSSLFSSAASPLDREQLFGAESGNASRSLTDRFNGPGMEKLQETSSGLAGVMARNKQALTERGEKLSALEIKTEQMNVQAKAFADAAHQLSMKYKEKKWYQV
ncbi:PREDICTED: syntaxin-binding protein 5-like [Acropora digitifera]|uniref:syntaxin-binding protein 5-like n=1 Tax=Acropora digitifera TaxID=70779 RepID=UPI00077B041A|nr:PREDICTED: syntaxin-binding protein 5-like [Acropora digitifera]